MEQAVNEVERQFAMGTAAKLPRNDDGALGADDDFTEAFAKVEADDIRRAGVAKKLPVDGCNGGVVHEGDAEFAKVGQASRLSIRVL
jgi:hypothetical protein